MDKSILCQNLYRDTVVVMDHMTGQAPIKACNSTEIQTIGMERLNYSRSVPQRLSSILLVFLSTLFLSTVITTAHRRHVQQLEPEDTICVDCVDMMFDYEYDIKTIIDNGASDCNQLCQTLYNQTRSKPILQTCNTICNKVGIKKIASAINKGGNNPYNFCELINVCKTIPNGDAKITSMVMPSVIKHGEHFNVTMTFKTVNGTSAGRTITYVNPPDSTEPHPLTNSTLLDALPPGTYTLTWYYMAKYDPNCTEHQCWDWPLGEYNVDVVLCSGQCWLEPPNNFVYDGRQLNFTVIKGD